MDSMGKDGDHVQRAFRPRAALWSLRSALLNLLLKKLPGIFAPFEGVNVDHNFASSIVYVP
ncbi:MAG TPA: hypothetical protein VKE93_05920 [Candidatus Angelobacter sp.]|nr:hypothetical protein [Candidatus Angelobacter sp.]